MLVRAKEIQIALRHDNFELFFQPVTPLASDLGSQCYGELQLRMCTQTGVTLGPRDFLPTAERYHLQPAIDRWFVKATIDALRRRHAVLADFDTIGISVSAQSVLDDDFLQYVVPLIESLKNSRDRLCFEIAESHLIKQWDRACTFVATVKGLGCRVALDGFGVGLHSFQLLKKLHVDYLKIHPEFVRNVAHNSLDYEVILGIARVAKALRIRTIATGVNNFATRDHLRSMGIDFAQGFLVEQARPLTIFPHAIH